MRSFLRVCAVLGVVSIAWGGRAGGAQNQEILRVIASPQMTAPIKRTLPALAQPDLKKALPIAEKYYKQALSKATPAEKTHLQKLVNWKPDFAAGAREAARARKYAAYSAYLTAATDLKGLYLPLAAALFALDTGSPLIAGNFASAIAGYPEDATRKPLARGMTEDRDAPAHAADAAAMYEYALALALSRTLVDVDAMPLLLNYGYLCIDTGRLANALPVLELAVSLAPGHPPAVQGLAAYWVAKGDRARAAKVLEGALPSARIKKLKKSIEAASGKDTPNVLPGDSAEVMQAKLDRLKSAEPPMAIEYYGDLDPEGVEKAKRFVDGLKEAVRFKAPEYGYLSQYSTLAAFHGEAGSSAFDAFQEHYFALEERLDETKRTDEEVDEMEDAVDSFLKRPGRSKEDRAARTAELIKATQIGPELLVLTLKPDRYANPTDVLAQQYNSAVMRRKRMSYEVFFAKQFAELDRGLGIAKEVFLKKRGPLEKAMEDELEQLSREHDSSHRDGPSGCNACIVKTHRIHQKYDTQLNHLVEAAWMDRTNFVNGRYTQQIKPNLEAMYVELAKHVLLMSDPVQRAQAEKNLKREVENLVFVALTQVQKAYSLDTRGYPYECDCSEAEVAAASERLRKAEERNDAEATAMQNRARKAFEAGGVPENSQLYKRLDQYTQTFHLMFMDAKWHPLKTEVTFGVKMPLSYVMDEKPNDPAELSFKMVQDHARNTVTVGGGLGVSLSKGEERTGALGIKGAAALKGEVTLDGNLNVISGDVVATAQASATVGFLEASAEYEASVMRGCKVSAEVAAIYNEKMIGKNPVTKDSSTYDAISYDKFSDSNLMPSMTRKVLWRGEHQVTN